MANEGILRRYPIFPYIILVYILPLPILLLRFFDLPFEPILIYASWTPNIAAFLVLGVILRQRGGIKKLISGWGKWKAGIRWYVIAVSPLFVAFLAAGVFIGLGGSPITPEKPVGFPLLISFIISLITGAMGEELGWRGFLLSRLQSKFNALISSLIVGVIWAVWHLPLWTLTGYGWEAIPYWTFALSAISTSVLFTWVLNNTGGSLVMATLIHFMMNLGMNVVGILGLLPSPGKGWTIAAILFAIYAIIIVLIAGPKNLSRHMGEKLETAGKEDS
ncbi:MAG: CPBP family intramembrane metalloprotease [Spirochaetota bacterium]|nr:MAG: CPBP family intramembrane metalloprotease [Spirochaetota bacterium]